MLRTAMIVFALAFAPAAVFGPPLVLGNLTQDPFAPKVVDASEVFFKKGEIPRLRIELTPENIEKLRANPREWVPCKLRENEKTVFEGVSVKLKGSAGSFREFDDKPALTIKMDRESEELRFHGLSKFHLNNSVQDPSYLHELLGSELFRAVGIATPRVTHARVWLNERDVGFYVLKEGFDKLLLKRFFENASGNLYDGGFCQDIDADLNKECGKGPADHSDLKLLREACKEPDMVKRWARLNDLVDIKSFITFCTMELMVCHWDGYCLNQNNYRIYIEPKSGKAFFLAHGMDGVLNDPTAEILDAPTALIASSVLKNPEWRSAFRKRIGELLPQFDANKLCKRVDEVSRRITTALGPNDRDAAREYEAQTRALKGVLVAREKFLREQLSQPEPRPLVFNTNVPVKLEHWKSMSEVEDAQVTDDEANGDRNFVVTCGKSDRCIAGFRRSVLLAKGHYRFHASLQVKDVVALSEEAAPGVGAGLRISGATRDEPLLGSGNFKAIQFDFEVTEERRDVELIIELRASQGQLRIKPDSLRLTRLSQ